MDDTSDAMFLDIGHQELGRSLSKSTVCSRCGAFVIYLDALDLRQLHETWHHRNDHSGPLPGNGETWVT